MTTPFDIHTVKSAPEASRPLLEQAQKGFGFVPNLLGVFAESPATLEGYMTLSKIFEKSSFDATERQVVLISTILENGCTYCMAAHSGIALQQGVPEEVVQALRNGTLLPSPRLESLREFTLQVVRERGWVSDGQVQEFLAVGFTRAQVLEVILGVSLKVLSNYTNHVTEPELDEAFAAHAWTRDLEVQT